MSYLDYRTFLDDIYMLRKQKLGRYSYAQLAEDLGFSHSNVIYLIIKGKRSISEKSAKTIVATLKLTSLQKNYFMNLVRYQNTRKSEERDELFRKLILLKSSSLATTMLRDQLAFFSEWYHSALFEAIEIKGFKPDPKWIEEHLKVKVSRDKISASLQLLENLGLTKFDEKTERYNRTRNRITTADEVTDFAIATYHQRMIDLGKESIFQVDEGERDIGSVTIAIPSHLLPKLKKEMNEFQEKVLALAEQSRDPKSVYQLNLQLFPLIKVDDDAS